MNPLVPGSSPGGPTINLNQPTERGLETQLKLLITLQESDSRILEKQSIIRAIPFKISEVEVPLQKAQAALDKMKQQYELLEKKRRNKERSLDDMNEKIKKLKARTSEIKTNKEYQAHLKEIESAGKERYAIEDEILSLMEQIEASSREIKSEEVKLESEKEKLEAFKKQLEQEIQEAEKELSFLREERSKVVTSIDRELYDLYMTLMNSGRGLAVTEAREEVCQGCNMNIPPQLFVEIKKNEEIIQCPQCHRILYHKSTP